MSVKTEVDGADHENQHSGARNDMKWIQNQMSNQMVKIPRIHHKERNKIEVGDLDVEEGKCIGSNGDPISGFLKKSTLI